MKFNRAMRDSLVLLALLLCHHAQANLPRYNGILRLIANECQAALMPASWPERRRTPCPVPGTALVREQQVGSCNYYALAAVLDRSPVFGAEPQPVSVGYMVFSQHLFQLFNGLVHSSLQNKSLQSFAHLRSRGVGGFGGEEIDTMSRLDSFVPLNAVSTAFEDNIEQYIDQGSFLMALIQLPEQEQAALIGRIRQDTDGLHEGPLASHLSIIDFIRSPRESALNRAWQEFRSLALRALPPTWGMTAHPNTRAITKMTRISFVARLHQIPAARGDEDEFSEEIRALMEESILPSDGNNMDLETSTGHYPANGARPTFTEDNNESRSLPFSRIQTLIAQSLNRGTPVLIGMQWPTFLQDHDGVLHFAEGRIGRLTPEAMNELQFNHAVAIVDLLKNEKGAVTYYVLQNSWGTDAGNAGHFYITPGYLSVLMESMTVLRWSKRRSTSP